MTVKALKKKNNMSGPFKMKGNPMQRNFGISPVRKDEKSGRTESGNTTLYGKAVAAKDALLSGNFVKSYISNKKDIREGNYEGFENKKKK